MTSKSVKYSLNDTYQFDELIWLMRTREKLGIDWEDDDPRWIPLHNLFYEVLFDVEIDETDGNATITHVNGVALHVE